jgi:hypothetical protein
VGWQRAASCCGRGGEFVWVIEVGNVQSKEQVFRDDSMKRRKKIQNSLRNNPVNTYPCLIALNTFISILNAHTHYNTRTSQTLFRANQALVYGDKDPDTRTISGAQKKESVVELELGGGGGRR